MSEEQAQDSGQQPQYLDIKQVDQEALQKEFEAGILSLRELSAKFGMDPGKGHVQITRLAKREGWVQDQNARIQAKAESKLQKKLAAEQAKSSPGTPAKRLTDSAVIDANAEAIVQVRLRHRTDIGRALSVTLKLLDELEHLTDNQEQLESLGDLMHAPDPKTGKDRLNEIYHAVISHPERVKSGKALSETLKNLIGLEREAYNIPSADDPNKPGNGMKVVAVKDYTGRG